MLLNHYQRMLARKWTANGFFLSCTKVRTVTRIKNKGKAVGVDQWRAVACRYIESVLLSSQTSLVPIYRPRTDGRLGEPGERVRTRVWQILRLRYARPFINFIHFILDSHEEIYWLSTISYNFYIQVACDTQGFIINTRNAKVKNSVRLCGLDNTYKFY